MSNLIVIGHGGYGTGVKSNLNMLLGSTPNVYYIDFDTTDTLTTLNDKIQNIIKKCEDEEILFACDLAGGSPFKQAAMLAADNSKFMVIAGLNTAAYCEIIYRLDMPVAEIADLALKSVLNSLVCFPNKI